MMTVSEVMTRDPFSITRDTLLLEIVRTLKESHIRQLPVVSPDGHLVGIVTDRDVRLALNSPLVLRGRGDDMDLMRTVMAEAIMTSDPLSVSPETSIVEAARLLAKYKFGALPVVSGEKLVGIISTTDLLSCLADRLEHG